MVYTGTTSRSEPKKKPQRISLKTYIQVTLHSLSALHMRPPPHTCIYICTYMSRFIYSTVSHFLQQCHTSQLGKWTSKHMSLWGHSHSNHYRLSPSILGSEKGVRRQGDWEDNWYLVSSWDRSEETIFFTDVGSLVILSISFPLM